MTPDTDVPLVVDDQPAHAIEEHLTSGGDLAGSSGAGLPDTLSRSPTAPGWSGHPPGRGILAGGSPGRCLRARIAVRLVVELHGTHGWDIDRVERCLARVLCFAPWPHDAAAVLH